MFSLGVLRRAVGEHLDLVEPMHAEDAAGVLAMRPGLATETRREPGVAQWQRLRISSLWYAANGTSAVPTRYMSSSARWYTFSAACPRKPVPAMASGRTRAGGMTGVNPLR